MLVSLFVGDCVVSCLCCVGGVGSVVFVFFGFGLVCVVFGVLLVWVFVCWVFGFLVWWLLCF